jgi:ferritin-like protein
MNTPAQPELRTRSIRNREELIQVLGIASELEHNLMCQYLFAVYSLKRYPAEGLTEAQLDQARGWGSLITMVARQEMEHLGLVMNLRSAIGAPPSFSRPNFPQPATRYGKADIVSVLTRFSPDTIARFQKFEQPQPLPADFCSMAVDEARRHREHAIALWQLAPAVTRSPLEPFDFQFDSVQSLYESVRRAFRDLPDLFIGSPQAQIFGGPGSPYAGLMDDLNQYDVDLVRVTDRDSALKAIHIIVEQGEGIQAPPDYVEHTHYCSFTRILNEMPEAGFDAARPVVDNPLTVLHMDITTPGEVNLITNPDTLQVAVLFNRCYELMLVLLLYLYGSRGRYPQRSLEFTNAIFFPLMTMFVRPIAEILTQLPAFADRPGNAGPGFELPGEIVVFPDYRYLWNSIDDRFRTLADDFEKLNILQRPHDHPPAIVERLRYTSENMRRLSLDWHSHWADVGYTIPE